MLLRRYLKAERPVAKGLDLGVPLGCRLTTRERQVLGHLIRDRTKKTIAKQLGVSESTVKMFVTTIYEKLEVPTRLDLLSMGIERGWV